MSERTSEMVERVAKAIALHPDGGNVTPGSNLLTRNNVSQWDDLARAAIAAMREPTEEMEKEAWRCMFGNLRPEEAYRHMIDVALRVGCECCDAGDKPELRGGELIHISGDGVPRPCTKPASAAPSHVQGESGGAG